MSVYKQLDGAIWVCDVIGGQLVCRRYYGYTKREAVRLFREEMLCK